MRFELRQQLAELARRGQWVRCLRILKNLAASNKTVAQHEILRHPSLLRRVVQEAEAQTSNTKATLKSAEAVLLLCGQTLRFAGQATTDSSQRCKETPQETNEAVDDTHEHVVVLPISEQQEWALLITTLLRTFLRSEVNSCVSLSQARTSKGALPALAEEADAVSSAKDVADAVHNLCEWSGKMQLDVDAALIAEAKIKAVAQSKPRGTAGMQKEDDEATGASTRAEGVVGSPEKHQEHVVFAAQSSSRVGTFRKTFPKAAPAGVSPSSRMPQRLAAAWRRATLLLESSSSLTQSKRFNESAVETFEVQIEADARAGFQQALMRLDKEEDAAASADFVLSSYQSVCQTLSAEAPEGQATQLLCIFCVMCEEVLTALAALLDTATASVVAGASEVPMLAVHSTVLIAAAELAALRLPLENNNAVSKADLPLSRNAPSSPQHFLNFEGRMHARRATRWLSAAVLKMGDATLCVAEMPAGDISKQNKRPQHTDKWLLEGLTKLQHVEEGDGALKAVGLPARLLRVLTNAASSSTNSDLFDEDTQVHATAAAAQLVMRALTTDSTDRGAVLSASVLHSVRCALHLAQENTPLGRSGSSAPKTSRHPRKRVANVPADLQDAAAASPLPTPLAEFLCGVLDACPVRLVYALLTGSCLSEEGDARLGSTVRTLSTTEETQILRSLQLLSSGIVLRKRERTVALQSGINSMSAASSVSPNAAAQTQFSFLQRVFAHLSVDSLTKLAQRLVVVRPATPSHGINEEVAQGNETPHTQAAQHTSRTTLLLQRVLNSVPDLTVRSTVAQNVLSCMEAGFVSSVGLEADLIIADASFNKRELQPDRIKEVVLLMGVALRSLLENTEVSAATTAACTQRALSALSHILTKRHRANSSGLDEVQRGVCCSCVRAWAGTNIALLLLHHTQLVLASSQPSHEKFSATQIHVAGDEQQTRTDSTAGQVRLTSAALQCAEWLEEQASHFKPRSRGGSPGRGGSLPPSLENDHCDLHASCCLTPVHIRRLCSTAEYCLKHSEATLRVLASPSPTTTGSVKALAVQQSVCAAVCLCTYEHVGVAQLCHLAIAATPAHSFSVFDARHAHAGARWHSAPLICALLDAPATTRPSHTQNSSGVSCAAHPLCRLRAASPTASRDGPLNVLQLHQGTPLTSTQHTQLVAALQSFSRSRSVHDAVALFYAHERAHRRLTLKEVELFSDVAKRATAAFLIRLLAYVPPPRCESAVLAHAVVKGAWRSYQRALRLDRTPQSSRTPHRTAPSRRSVFGEGGHANGSALHREHIEAETVIQEKRANSIQQVEEQGSTIEQAWYEAVAIAVHAMELLPLSSSSFTAATLPHAPLLDHTSLQTLLTTLYRLVYAQPGWNHTQRDAMDSPQDKKQTSWDVRVVRTAILTNQLLLVPSLRCRLQQEMTVRNSISELQQTVDFCTTQHDAETAVRAYMRFVRTHTAATPLRTVAQSRIHQGQRTEEKWRRVVGVDAVLIPLLPLDTYASLLTLASAHVLTSESTPEAWLCSFTDQASAGTVESALQSARDALAAPPPPPTAVSTSAPIAVLEGVEGQSDSHTYVEQTGNLSEGQDDMEELYRLRADMEGTATPPADDVKATSQRKEEGVAGSQNGARGKESGRESESIDASLTLTPAAQRRSSAFRANCAAAYTAIAATLPLSLSRAVEADMTLTPLIVVLHNGLRWCQLRPRRRFDNHEDAGLLRFGETEGEVSTFDTDAIEDAAAAGADVLSKLVASTLHLTLSMLHVGGTGLDADDTDFHGGSLQHARHDAADTPCGTTVSCLFSCSLPFDSSSWKLMRYAGVVLTYVLRYLKELHAVSNTTLYTSPAQQQRGAVVLLECLQVVYAAMEAVDVWAAEYKAHRVAELGPHAGATREAAFEEAQGQDSDTTCPLTQQNDDNLMLNELADVDVDAFRLQLRGAPLQLLKSQLAEVRYSKWMLLPPGDSAKSFSRALREMRNLVESDVRTFEACSPTAPSMSRLSSLPGKSFTESFLGACSQTHYSALVHFIDAVTSTLLPDGARSEWSGKQLSYVLRCLSAHSAATSSLSGGSDRVNVSFSLHGGAVQGLLARVAATDVTLRRLISDVNTTRLQVEAANIVKASHGSGTEQVSGGGRTTPVRQALLAQLMRVSSAFHQTALLLDECTAAWNVLHLQSTVHRARDPFTGESLTMQSQQVLLSRQCSAVQWSLVESGLLEHIRSEMARLRTELMSLYVTAWWKHIVALLDEDGEKSSGLVGSFWSDENVRMQHLYVASVLLSLSQSGKRIEVRSSSDKSGSFTNLPISASSEAKMAFCVEKLQQAMMRYPRLLFAAAQQPAEQRLHQGVVDFEALLEEGGANTDAASERAVHVYKVERVLLTMLVERSVPSLQAKSQALSTEQICVSAVQFERIFQAAVARVPWQSATVLWRVLPLLYTQTSEFSLDEVRVDGSSHSERHAPGAGTACKYAIPRKLWQVLTEVANSSLKNAENDVIKTAEERGGGTTTATTTAACFDVHNVVALALLSPTPLVEDGLVAHPLLRQRLRQEVGENDLSASAAHAPMWLKQLITFGMDEAEAATEPNASTFEMDSDEASDEVEHVNSNYFTLPASYLAARLAAGVSINGRDPSGRPRIASISTLLPTALCQRVVPSIVQAVLSDSSLIPKCAAPLFSPPAADEAPLLHAVDGGREARLRDALHHLGYVAPQAWSVALEWIVNTPFPSVMQAAAEKRTMLDAEATGCVRKATMEEPGAANTLANGSPVERCTLQRLRVAFLACGPWPAEVARPLLRYALHCQEAVNSAVGSESATQATLHGSSDFPEAGELYRLYGSAEMGDHVGRSEEALTAVLASPPLPEQHPLFVTSVAAHLVDTLHPSAKKGKETRIGDGRSMEGTQEKNFGVNYDACTVDRVFLGSPPGVRSTIARHARFRVLGESTARTAAPPTARAGERGGPEVSVMGVPSSLLASMQPLSHAPSMQACLQLLHTREWTATVLAVRRQQVGPALELLWRTLLLRKAELDVVGVTPAAAAVMPQRHKISVLSDQDEKQSNRNGSGSRATEEHARSASNLNENELTFSTNDYSTNKQRPRQVQLSLSEEAAAWKDVCATMAMLIAEAAGRFTVMTFHTGAKLAKVRRMAAQLDALHREVCRFWASTLLEPLLLEAATRSATNANGAVTQSTQDDLGASSAVHDASDGLFPPELIKGMRAQIELACQEASRSMQKSSDGGAAQGKSDEAEAENDAVKENICQEVQRAVKELTCKPAEDDEVAHAQWALWPPAAWEFRQLQQHLLRGHAESAKQAFLNLRNPFVVVAVMQAWHCRHAGKSEANTKASLTPSPESAYVQYLTSLFMDDSSSASPKKRTSICKWTLYELWQAADAYVHRGYFPLPSKRSSRRSAFLSMSKAAHNADPQIEAVQRGFSASVSGSQLVMQAFLQLVSAEDARLRERRDNAPQHRHDPATAEELLTLKAVLRGLRAQLVHGTCELDARCDDVVSVASTAADNPWAAYVPPCLPAHSFNRRRSADAKRTPWHAYLHVLHLCTDGLLDGSSRQRGRRATPTAAAMQCVTTRLQKLLRSVQASCRGAEHATETQAPENEGDGGQTRSSGAVCDVTLLSAEDGQRILCWQLRQLQRLQSHVNALGWTAEQQQQHEIARWCLQISVSCVVSLTKERSAKSQSQAGSGATSSPPLNSVEAATAACFYPHLATLIQTAEKRKDSESQSLRPAKAMNAREGEEVLTTFADQPKLFESARRDDTTAIFAEAEQRSHRGDAPASALLGGVRNALNGAEQVEEKAGREAESPSTTGVRLPAELRANYAVLHAWLARVLSRIEDRAHNADPALLLRFLDGSEATSILQELGSKPEHITDALLRLLSHLLHLLEASMAVSESGTSRAICETGLHLAVAVQPWLPKRCNATSNTLVQQRLTEAALTFSYYAVAEGKAEGTMENETVAHTLVSCALDGVLRQRQAEALSSQGVALLGLLHVQLFSNSTRRSSSAAPGELAQAGLLFMKKFNSLAASPTAAMHEMLLWRLLHALSALGERDAALVHECWIAHTSPCASERQRGAAQSTTTPAPLSAAATAKAKITRQGEVKIDLQRRANGAVAKGEGARSVAGELYCATLSLLTNGGAGDRKGTTHAGATKMNDDFFRAAVRLRTWWSAKSRVSITSGPIQKSEMVHAVAPVLFFEDLLCQGLSNESSVKEIREASTSSSNNGRGRVSAVSRSARQANLELFHRYLAACRTVSNVKERNVVNEAIEHRVPAASLVLQVEVAATFTHPAEHSATRSSTAANDAGDALRLSDAYLVELLAAVAATHDTLLRAKTEVMASVGASALPLSSTRVHFRRDVTALANHLLVEMSRQLRERRDARSRSAVSSSAALLQSWEAIVTPLRALYVAEALEVDAASVVLIRTARGLQCKPVSMKTDATLLPERSLTPPLLPALYRTLSYLIKANQLLRVPLSHLVHELLLPLLVLESRDTHGLTPTATRTTAAQIHNRRQLLQSFARQLAAHPALFHAPHNYAEIERRIERTQLCRLGDAIAAAEQLTITASDGAFFRAKSPGKSKGLSESQQQTALTDLHGWPAALLLLKIFARLDSQLCKNDKTANAEGTAASFTAVHCDDDDVAAAAFAAHYATSLARRSSALVDYLAFVLVAQRYVGSRDALYSGRDGRRDAGAEGRHEKLRSGSQLQHAIAAVVPPHSIGAATSLFRPLPELRSEESSLFSMNSESPQNNNNETLMNGGPRSKCEDAPSVFIIAAATESEVQQLHALRCLLDAPPS